MPSPMIHSVTSFNVQAHSRRILKIVPRDSMILYYENVMFSNYFSNIVHLYSAPCLIRSRALFTLYSTDSNYDRLNYSPARYRHN